MQKLFNKILVPIDFSSSSEKLLDRVIDMANKYSCSIHLMYIVSPSLFSFFKKINYKQTNTGDMIDNKKELEARMEKYCSYIDLHCKNGNTHDYSILKGTWNQTIIEKVNIERFDLILIGQKTWLGRLRIKINPDKLAMKTNVPVITVPPHRALAKLTSIVIPVTDFLPLNKLIYGIYMASCYNATLKLLGVENEHNDGKVEYYIQKAYGLINDNCSVPVELEMVISNSVADAVNVFSYSHKTDLVILNPGNQSHLPGFFPFWGRILQRYARWPVLTINQA